MSRMTNNLKILVDISAAIYRWRNMLYLLHLSRTPIAQLEAARKALHDAKINQSQTFAESLHRDDTHNYESAIKYWKRKMTNMVSSRLYDVAFLANKARLGAIAASKKSTTNKRDISTKLSTLLKELNEDCAYFESTFKHIPLPASLLKTCAQK